MHHMAQVFTAPDYITPIIADPSIFLGGGISNAKNWQPIVISDLEEENCVIYNPRRNSFDLKDESMNNVQVEWEYKFLHFADILVFYFVSETVCPITLFELGAALERNVQSASPQKIIVYCEPGYTRTFDVNKQVSLINSDSRRLAGGMHAPLALLAADYKEFIRMIKQAIKKPEDGFRVSTSISEFERIKPRKTYDKLVALETLVRNRLGEDKKLKDQLASLKESFLAGE